MSEMTYEEIGKIEFYSEDLGILITIKSYLKNLLQTLWEERAGFSGKRPFGNSSWESDLEIALLKAGLIEGKLDEHGYVDEIDSEAAFRIIRDLIGSF